MQRVPKQIIDEMLKILYINEQLDISDESSRKALDFAKKQSPLYRKTLYTGLYLLIKKYRKKVKQEKKRNALLGK